MADILLVLSLIGWATSLFFIRRHYTLKIEAIKKDMLSHMIVVKMSGCQTFLAPPGIAEEMSGNAFLTMYYANIPNSYRSNSND